MTNIKILFTTSSMFFTSEALSQSIFKMFAFDILHTRKQFHGKPNHMVKKRLWLGKFNRLTVWFSEEKTLGGD